MTTTIDHPRQELGEWLLVVKERDIFGPRDARRVFDVECLGSHGWFFCSRVHDIQEAVDWCAAFRMVKGLPARVVER
jgi:hypothetical protein